MKINIELSNEHISCLRKHLPPGSSALAVLDRSVHLVNSTGVPMGDEWLTFTVAQARELLATAEGHCQDAVFKIKLAMRQSGVTVA